ncbi:hypothetical protein EJB05_50214 [Eragrostis curvula]|uniref:Uncharacterized protein n=1 Tax=Eragrostis curvula TaxID=38414 RepID=A0A5J9SYM9_9POAL|nr:hypothetical protein EJB05_50214 [Eragrostis curvula]
MAHHAAFHARLPPIATSNSNKPSREKCGEALLICKDQQTSQQQCRSNSKSKSFSVTAARRKDMAAEVDGMAASSRTTMHAIQSLLAVVPKQRHSCFREERYARHGPTVPADGEQCPSCHYQKPHPAPSLRLRI